MMSRVVADKVKLSIGQKTAKRDGNIAKISGVACYEHSHSEGQVGLKISVVVGRVNLGGQ